MEHARINPRDLNREFDNAADPIFNTPIAAVAEAAMHLMQLPRNPETQRIIKLTLHAVKQLERQNPLSSLHGTRSRATASIAPQASRTPGGHHRQQQHNRRNQEEQEVTSGQRPWGGQPAANQAPRPQQNRNNSRGHNHEEVADSGMDARDIINARRQAHLADSSYRFPALSSVFDNVEYPKDFKPTNILKYDGKQDPA